MTPRADRPDDDLQVVLTDVVRRWWLRAVVVAAVLAGLGAAYASTRPATYTSTVRVSVALLPGNPMSPAIVTSTGPVESAMTSELALVTSSQVIDAVGAELGVKVDTRSISASVATNTDIVVVRFQDRTADRAGRGALRAAQAYLDLREARARSTVAGQLQSVESQVRASTAALQEIDLQSQVAIYVSQIGKLQQSVAELKETTFVPGTIIDRPADWTSSNGLPHWIYPFGAGVIGLVITGLLAVRQTRRGRLIRGAGLSMIRGRPILGTVRSPEFGPTAESGVSSLDGVYAQIRTSMLGDVPSGSVLAMCSIAGEDLGEIAVNLAASLRAAHFTSVVVDALPGASNESRGQADYVIVCGPAASTPEGLSVALRAHAVVLSVRDGVTTRAQTYEVMERMEQVGVSIIGVVVISGSPKWRRRRRRSAPNPSGPVPSPTSTVDGVLAGAPGP